MFSALSAVKFAVTGVVGIGTGKIVGAIIKNNVSPETLVDKTSIAAATWAISGLVTTTAKAYTDKTIDQVHGFGVGMVKRFKVDGALGRINRKESTFEKEGLDPMEFMMDDSKKWVRRDKTEVEPETIKYVVAEDTTEEPEPDATKFQAVDGKYGSDEKN